MNAVLRTSRLYKQHTKLLGVLKSVNYKKGLSTEAPNEPTESTDPKLGGYAKAFAKFEAQYEKQQEKATENQSFSYLLRNSKFIDVCKYITDNITVTYFICYCS